MIVWFSRSWMSVCRMASSGCFLLPMPRTDFAAQHGGRESHDFGPRGLQGMVLGVCVMPWKRPRLPRIKRKAQRPQNRICDGNGLSLALAWKMSSIKIFWNGRMRSILPALRSNRSQWNWRVTILLSKNFLVICVLCHMDNSCPGWVQGAWSLGGCGAFVLLLAFFFHWILRCGAK